MGGSIALYLISLYAAFHGYVQYDEVNAINNIKLGIDRALFCVLFYHFGYTYHHQLERIDDFSINKIVGLFVFNALLLGGVSSQIWMDIRSMTFPVHKYWLPMVEACSGIWLSLQISSILQHYVKNKALIHYIGRHTFSIMTHQQFFFWMANSMLFLINYWGIWELSSFSYDRYMLEIYYRIEAHPPLNRLIYLVAGVMGPVCCCWLYEKYAKVHVVNVCYNMKNLVMRI